MKIAVVLGGELKRADGLRERLESVDMIICADSGLRHVLSLGLTANEVVGDFDSFPLCEIPKGITVKQHDPLKDYSDFELALIEALRREPKEILVACALGGRSEFTMANLMTGFRPDLKKIAIQFYDGETLAQCIEGPKRVVIERDNGRRLSLVPVQSCVDVNLMGTVWPLTNASLPIGYALSISNVISLKEATLSIKEGRVIAFQNEGADDPSVMEAVKRGRGG